MRSKRWSLRLAGGLLWLALAPALLLAGTRPDARVKARLLIEKVRMEHGIPGLAVAVVKNDSIIWQEGFGYADVENGSPVRPESVFRIASISKPIAAVAVMQLVEQGKVKLDDPIQKYVPSFPQKRWKVTLRHLMTHTAGIRHYRPGEFEMKRSFDNLAEAIRIFKDDTLLFQPGTQFRYSTYGYNLLAGVVETATGMSFEAYLQKYVWGPAGMNHTYLEHPREIVPLRVRQYVLVNGDSLTNAPYADLSIKWAGGGMISTVGDLARFYIALDREILLKKRTQNIMYVPTLLPGGKNTRYGLGWRIWEKVKGHRWIGHTGGATGGTTILIRIPEKGFAVVIFANLQRAGIRKLAFDVAELFL